MICGLNILFLRKEEPGSLILQGGDIDNRMNRVVAPDRGQHLLVETRHAGDMCVGSISLQVLDDRLGRLGEAQGHAGDDAQVVIDRASVDVAERQPAQKDRVGLRGAAWSHATALLSRLPCVSITPLGLPVVPDVYMIVARSSGRRSRLAALQLGRSRGRPAGRAAGSRPTKRRRRGRGAVEDDDAAQVRQLAADLPDLVELVGRGDEQPAARRRRRAGSGPAGRSAARAAAR